jgi:transposase InsO family protein
MKQIELKTYELRCQVDLIRQVHPGCGVEKMYYQLKPDWIGRDRFMKLFMALGYGIQPHKRFCKTTIPIHIKFPNLIEGLLVFGINTVWQSDITYYRIGEDLCYLVFIEDIYSRRILGYQASNHLRAQANIQALQMAFKTRICNLRGTIHHSDRGSQYSDHVYLDMLDRKNILVSMGLRGQDNAYVERINGIIKNEYLKYWTIDSLEQLQDKLKKAVNHYNNKRPHRSLPGRLSPIEFEEMIKKNLENYKLNEWIYSEKLNINQKKCNFEISDLTEKTLVCPITDY